ncbi:hypothetical protein DRP53_07370 [candidate division WOR-3 bacterium]|uniref:Secretion system C-terminal sorting domain-containing protein n=1 Tax=candidate division WOR-3 bacterium TaxID=2052148 RepID=A0A660SI42_UNCW3|nr:MAG: hypothetical protein DRP53_07370 [candidate division WOR-3 bacterium]
MRYSLLIFIIGSLSGITFERTYGKAGITDIGYSVWPTADGGYIIGGTTEPGDYFRSYLIKADSVGDTIWSTVSSTYNGIIVSVLQTDDHGYFSLDKNIYSGSFNFQFARYDSSGKNLWRKSYGGDKDEEPHALKATKDGNYIAIGGTKSYGWLNWEVWLVKVDTSGNLLWSRTYWGAKDEIGYDIDLVGDGYIIVGFTNSLGAGDRDVLLIRTDSIGDSLWMRVYGGPDDDIGMAVRATPDGGFIIAGATYSFGAGGYDVYLIKTDSLGDTLWMRTYGGPDWDGGFGLCLSADSCYVVVGETRSYGFGLSDLYLLKVDRDGNLIWEKTYGFADEDRGYEVHLTPDHGFIIVGATRGEHGNDWQVYLLKVDSLGNIGVSESPGYDLPIRIYPNPSSGWLFIDGDGVSSVTLFDVSGRELRRLSVGRRVKLNLPAGIYFLRIETKAGPSHEKILILE